MALQQTASTACAVLAMTRPGIKTKVLPSRLAILGSPLLLETQKSAAAHLPWRMRPPRKARP